MNDPWAFGWTQLFTIIGFAITIAIAVGGFRTFSRWKREKLEERRIEVAIDALSLTYKARWVFDNIRSDMSSSPEWKDMPEQAGDTEAQRSERGPFYAALKRIEAQRDFFQRAWELQVVCMAVFGPEAEETFLLLHRARREVEVAAQMLWRDPHPQHQAKENLDTWEQWRGMVWQSLGKYGKQGDPVGEKLSAFREGMEKMCRPVIDRNYRTAKDLVALAREVRDISDRQQIESKLKT